MRERREERERERWRERGSRRLCARLFFYSHQTRFPTQGVSEKIRNFPGVSLKITSLEALRTDLTAPVFQTLRWHRCCNSFLQFIPLKRSFHLVFVTVCIACGPCVTGSGFAELMRSAVVGGKVKNSDRTRNSFERKNRNNFSYLYKVI